MTVHVGYATEHGSTREIASRIAERLGGHGFEVETMPMTDTRHFDDHDAFVLGSAIHNQAWLPVATDCIARGLPLLRERQVWLFSVGMPAALRGPWRRFAMKEEAKVSADLRKALRPRGHRLFSGVFLPHHVSATGRLVFRAMGCRFGDYRDWAGIEAWADEIAEQLGHRTEDQGPVDADAKGPGATPQIPGQ